MKVLQDDNIKLLQYNAIWAVKRAYTCKVPWWYWCCFRRQLPV